jgi:hypothetical protein
MPQTIRYDDPIMATALAVGVGTEQGQAIVDNIIYERTRQRAEEARVRADRQKYGDERVVGGGGGYDRPYVRQPRGGGGWGGTGQPTPYQSGQLDLAQQRIDLQREKQGAPPNVPQITPYQQAQLDRDGQRDQFAREKEDYSRKRDGMNALGNIAKWFSGKVDTDRKFRASQSNIAADNRRADRALDIREQAANTPKIPPRQAAASAVSVMAPNAIAKSLLPLMQPETTYVDENGNPYPGPWDDKSITLAQNLAKAIENMPFEVLPNGLPAYSLPQLMQRRNELEAGGVPRSVILMLDRAIEARSQKEMSGQAGTPVAASPDAEIDITPEQAERVRLLRDQGYDFEMALQQVIGAGVQ